MLAGLDCNDILAEFSHKWRKQENQTGKVLEEIKWKQNRNWLQCLGEWDSLQQSTKPQGIKNTKYRKKNMNNFSNYTVISQHFSTTGKRAYVKLICIY